MQYFKDSEFTCKCGCHSNKMQTSTLQMLDNARKIANCPFIITSGYRCSKHNANVGGSKTSSHLLGYAADIAYKSDLQLTKIVYGLVKAGFNRIGVNESKHFIHVDNDPNKPFAIFTY